MTSCGHLFEAFLEQHDETAWNTVLERLHASIHPVDRAATTIWFAFYPLALARALDDPQAQPDLPRRLRLQGRFRLADQVGTSHRFLYGHRYWPAVHRVVQEAALSSAAPRSLELQAIITGLADAAAARVKQDGSLLIGITAVAVMTLQQVGCVAYSSAVPSVHLSPEVARRTPDEVLAARARDDRQGLRGLLTGTRRWTVTFDETEPNRSFQAVESQELATAAANDKSDFHAVDPRCVPGEGVIPVQCRSASCGTCWVGVLGGADKLSPVVERDEGRQIKLFGYIDTADPKPLIRLACQAQAFGAVSIVIPPWNGVFGRYLRPAAREGQEV